MWLFGKSLIYCCCRGGRIGCVGNMRDSPEEDDDAKASSDLHPPTPSTSDSDSPTPAMRAAAIRLHSLIRKNRRIILSQSQPQDQSTSVSEASRKATLVETLSKVPPFWTPNVPNRSINYDEERYSAT